MTEIDGETKRTSHVRTFGRQTGCHYQQVTWMPSLSQTLGLDTYVWTFSVKGKPRHVCNKILSLLSHKFVNLWRLNVPCHEENILLHLSSWPSFITQENKMKLQISFIAMLTDVAHFSVGAHLIICSLSIFLPCNVCFEIWYSVVLGARGGAVVEAVRNKPKGRGIDSRWCHWNFSLT
jgi:hypothetical protein